jgi:hypothetical protein
MGYLKAMSIQPEGLPLHAMTIETSHGAWGIYAHSAAETQAGGTLLLKLTLETSIDEDGEHIRTREVDISVPAHKLDDPNSLADVIGQICGWAETTEGDGFWDLTLR